MISIPLCFECSRLRSDFRCTAFPDGIPESILFGDADHREPFPGDNGIRFEPLDADAE